MLTSSPESHVSRTRDMSVAVGSQRGRVAVFCAVLFLSGTGALIFETLWLRVSGLAFGNSVWAAALILSSFMAGLALGNGNNDSSGNGSANENTAVGSEALGVNINGSENTAVGSVYEVRPCKNKRRVDLISDALPIVL